MIALRKDGVLNFVMGDHPSTLLRASLGSTRGNMNTDYQYTGQRTVVKWQG
jgi:hypothetical protein